MLATFERHGVTVLHLDHEAFGIYVGQIEPTYDVHVDGRSEGVLAATDTLRMTPQDFEDTSLALLEELVQDYSRLNFSIQRFVIYMRRL